MYATVNRLILFVLSVRRDRGRRWWIPPVLRILDAAARRLCGLRHA
jgi:hypothetical protein